MSRSRRLTSAALLGALSSSVALAVRAEPVDSALPIVITVGAARTPAPLDRLDRARMGRPPFPVP